MRLDIRLPIGMLFSILGALLVGWGVFSDKAIYERSLGININVVWGLCVLAFGLVMLGLAWLGARAKSPAGAAAPSSESGGPRPASH